MNSFIKPVFLVLIISLLSGCTTETKFGKCVGAFEETNPALKYEVSVWNVVLASVFVETIFVPVLVVLDSTKCPVGEK